MNSLSDIAFLQIRDNFYLGIYDVFTVVMMKDCGFVNASKLCRDGGKEFFDWKRNKSSQELIDTLCRHMAQDSTQVNDLTCGDAKPNILGLAFKSMVANRDSDEGRLICGTYCRHPLLIPHIAAWISSEFALKVSKIVNNYLIQEYKTKLLEAEQKLQTMQQVAVETEQHLQVAQQVVAEKENHITELREDLIVTDTQRIHAETEVNSRKAILEMWASTHAFTMLRLDDPAAKMPYYAIRCKRQKMSPAINKLRKRFLKVKVIYQHRRVPNSINLYGRLRANEQVVSYHNFCDPAGDEADLISNLSELLHSDYPPENVEPLNAWVSAAAEPPTSPSALFTQIEPFSPISSAPASPEAPVDPPVQQPITIIIDDDEPAPVQSPITFLSSTYPCTQCNNVFLTLYQLYIHQRSCGFILNSILHTPQQYIEPPALWTYAPISNVEEQSMHLPIIIVKDTELDS